MSYAHAEDAWVEVFRKALKDEFQNRTGEEVTFWQDTQNLRVGQKWASEIEEGIRNAAAFMAVVSPTYLRSPWCVRERSLALENELEALRVESFYRFLKIIKTPGPGKAHEELLHDLQDIRFFNKADDYELPAGSPEFTAEIRALVRQVRELFRAMTNKAQEIYLAPGNIEMYDAREKLERELKDRAFTVKPEVLLDSTFPKDSIRREMERASIVVFVLGVYDKFTATQIEIAQELGKRVVFWVQPGETQNDILGRIHEIRDLPPGSEVIGGRSCGELIAPLLEKLRPKKPLETPAPASDRMQVYLNYDYTLPEDSGRAARIADVVRARKFEVVPSGRDGDHDRLMQTSNAVLLFRAANPHPDEWLKFNAMELVLPAQALERQVEFDAKALLVTEPARIQARLPNVPVYAYSEPFAPETLDPFFSTLTSAGSADARR